MQPLLFPTMEELQNVHFADNFNIVDAELPALKAKFNHLVDTQKEVGMDLSVAKINTDPSGLASEFGAQPLDEPLYILGCGFDPKTSWFFIPLDRMNILHISPRDKLGVLSLVF